jgi:hypothetical protein
MARPDGVALSIAPVEGMDTRHQGGSIGYIVHDPEWIVVNRAGETGWP